LMIRGYESPYRTFFLQPPPLFFHSFFLLPSLGKDKRSREIRSLPPLADPGDLPFSDCILGDFLCPSLLAAGYGIFPLSSSDSSCRSPMEPTARTISTSSPFSPFGPVFVGRWAPGSLPPAYKCSFLNRFSLSDKIPFESLSLLSLLKLRAFLPVIFRSPLPVSLRAYALYFS